MIVIIVTNIAFILEIDFLKNDMDLYCFELSIWRLKMKKIMLCCSAGMSTSLLVKKMEAAAVAKNLDVEIKAFGVAEFDENMPNYHVVLLGPQIKYMQNNLSSKASVYGIKVQPIDMLDYGMLRGDRVLDIALELAK